MSALRIALAQINGTVGDLAGNSARIVELIAKARDSGADLVIFPQLALPGYPPDDLLLRSTFLTANHERLAELASHAQGVSAIVGCIGTAAGDAAAPIYNAAAVLQAGTITGLYAKEELSARAPLAEPRYFQPGQTSGLFEIAGHPVGITIGDEIDPPGTAVANLAHAGARLIVNLAATPFQSGRRGARRRVQAALAREHGVVLAYVNRVGGQDGFIFDGGSALLSDSGEVIAEARPFEEELLLCDLALEPPAPTPARSPEQLDEDDDLADTYRALTIGIRDYARKNGFTHLTLGLSGGLDSALVATLAVDALGAEAVTALWMPSRYSSELSRLDAFALAQALGIELLTIPIEPAFDALLETLTPHFAGRPPDLTEENLQARIRGNLLMALSNKFGWLVLTTSNKSETAVGYTTLYGDMAGGLAPLKDVYKTVVFSLARWRNTQGEVIPHSTIERPPTAELRPAQLDTDSLPPYEVLDRILARYLEERWSAAQIIAEGTEPELVRRVLGLVDRSEYKRRQAPPGLKITSYAFGIDDQMPLTSRFREV